MEATTPAPTPLMPVGLWLDSRVTKNGLLGLSVHCTLHGKPPRKKTTGPFMSREQKEQVEKLLEDKKVFEDFQQVVEILDIQKLKNPFPPINTPGLSWVEILAFKTWTALYRVMQLACVLAQHRRLSIDYLFKVIDHFQYNHDKETRAQQIKFNYILNEPGLLFNPYQVVADALQLPLLAPPEPPQPDKEEEAAQLLPVLKGTPAIEKLREKAQKLLDKLPSEHQQEFITFINEMSQGLATTNTAPEMGVTQGKFTNVDEYVADPRRAITTLAKATAIQYLEPGDSDQDDDELTSSIDNYKPDSNFLEYMMTSIPVKEITEGSTKRYDVVYNFLVRYFKGINKLQYDDNGKPKITFTFLGKKTKRDKPGTLRALQIWMENKKYAQRTINDYLGLVSTVLGRAIEEGIITGRFNRIGQNKDVKLERPAPLERAVDEQILEYIFKYPASTKTFKKRNGWSEARAKILWLISYFCFGMNIGDIFRITKEQLKQAELEYYRHKRKNSAGKLPISIPLDEFIRGLFELAIQLQGGEIKNSPYALAGLELTTKEIRFLNSLEEDKKHGMSKEEVYKKKLEAIEANKIANIVRNINTYFKKIVKGVKETFNVDFEFKVTSYVARHNFVAWAKEQPEISLLMLSREYLGHESLETVNRNYGYTNSLKIKQATRNKMVESMKKGTIVRIEKVDENTTRPSPTPSSITLPEMQKAS